MSIYDQFIYGGDLIFDIGANVGDKSALFIELTGPQGRVIAVEPQQACLDELRKRFKRYKAIRVIGGAVGETKGYETLRRSRDLSSTATMSRRFAHATQKSGRFDNRWNDSEKVLVITLDSLILDYGLPDFVKIDVEGYEPEVVRGLSQPVRSLCFEFHPELMCMVEEVFKHADTLGPFETNYAVGNTPEKLELTDWASPNMLLQELKRFEGNNQDMGDIFIRWQNVR